MNIGGFVLARELARQGGANEEDQSRAGILGAILPFPLGIVLAQTIVTTQVARFTRATVPAPGQPPVPAPGQPPVPARERAGAGHGTMETALGALRDKVVKLERAVGALAAAAKSREDIDWLAEQVESFVKYLEDKSPERDLQTQAAGAQPPSGDHEPKETAEGKTEADGPQVSPTKAATKRRR